jgi:hypothetical protein
MGNFNEIVPRRINIAPAREATLAEAQNAPIPFDKYYRILPTREIRKLNTFFILSANMVPQATYLYLGRLMFQYNVIAPKPFYILKEPRTDEFFPCVLTVKWRVGTQVFRYFLDGEQQYIHITTPSQPGPPPFIDTIRNTTAFPIYNNQRIPINCVFECWSSSFNTFSSQPACGIPSDYKMEISMTTDPATSDDIENDIVVSNPIDVLGTQFTTFPVVYPLNAWPLVVFNSN